MVPLGAFCYRAYNAAGPSLGHRLQHAAAPFNGREALIGFSLLFIALIAFGFGLNDMEDPYRVFHGMWHIFGGFASLHLWRIVKNPTANETATAMARLGTLSGLPPASPLMQDTDNDAVEVKII